MNLETYKEVDKGFAAQLDYFRAGVSPVSELTANEGDVPNLIDTKDLCQMKGLWSILLAEEFKWDLVYKMDADFNQDKWQQVVSENWIQLLSSKVEI